jgi:hypothetical protein
MGGPGVWASGPGQCVGHMVGRCLRATDRWARRGGPVAKRWSAVGCGWSRWALMMPGWCSAGKAGVVVMGVGGGACTWVVSGVFWVSNDQGKGS